MATLSLFVGIVGNITSALIFLSPIVTFTRIIKQGSTEEFETLPYICTLLNCTLWVYYGIIKPGGLLIVTINGFGTIVEAIYLILFLVYAPKPMKVKTATLAGILNVGFLLIVVLFTQCMFEGEALIQVVGILAAGLCIIMYGSPLSAMRLVVRTRSLEYMPFLLPFSLFLNGGAWVYYSWLERDYFIGVSNGVGFVFGITLLVFYALYKIAKPSSDIEDTPTLEEGGGGLHEPLISSSDQDHGIVILS